MSRVVPGACRQTQYPHSFPGQGFAMKAFEKWRRASTCGNPAHPKPANSQNTPANILPTPANLCTAVHSLHRATPTGQGIKPLPPHTSCILSKRSKHVLRCGATGFNHSHYPKVVELHDDSRFLRPAETPPSLVCRYSPHDFFHTNPQSGCCASVFTRAITARIVAGQAIWAYSARFGRICSKCPKWDSWMCRALCRGQTWQQTSKLCQQTFPANTE